MAWDLFGFKRRRRERLRSEPVPRGWEEVIDAGVPHTRFLDRDEREELEHTMQVFLDRVAFEGAGGFVVDDVVRITIAAQACLLLIGQGDQEVYPRLSSVVVYPAAWIVEQEQQNPDGTVTVQRQRRLGESWGAGTLVLSWDDVERGAADVNDGQNVVFHEFAHQLDSEEPWSAGAPVLAHRAMYARWAQVLGGEFRALVDDIEHHRKHLLDAYGATNAAEFFAVTTEFFFERPRQLRQRHPELYEQFRLFFQQDPAARYDRAAAERSAAARVARRAARGDRSDG